MKFNYLYKSIPFLSTIFVIAFLCFSNQKENTKLKIIIWDTPSLPIGTYIAISSGTGFILSYFLTSYLANVNQPKLKEVIKYRYDSQQEEFDESKEDNNEDYANVLIERDINEPSPTINANFRVIGKTQRSNETSRSNKENENGFSTFSDEYEYQTYEEDTNYVNDYDINTKFNDWDDDSYANW